MIPFCIFIFLVLVSIIAFWNGVTDFKTAYIQAYILLVVMNWFDGIVLDRLWVGHSKIWKIEGMEGIPYIKPWKSVLVKRSLAMVIYLVVALVIAGLAAEGVTRIQNSHHIFRGYEDICGDLKALGADVRKA